MVFSYFYGSTNPFDYRDCHVNSFQPVCFSSSGSDHFNIREINPNFSQWYRFHPSPGCLCFPALPPSSSQSLSLFRASISFVWSLFSLPSIISTGEFSSCSSFFIPFFFRCTQFKFFRVIIFFSFDQVFSLLVCLSPVITPEFGRHLRRFVCVPINSRLLS